jgi:hypothetical protein
VVPDTLAMPPELAMAAMGDITAQWICSAAIPV